MNTRKFDEELKAIDALNEFTAKAYDEALEDLTNFLDTHGFVSGCYV
ncbi:MAG: hypothetical protein VKL39_23980 [Leptolyngbyaceae bacterium]|nr:hypothetical protein [Leptolyngbyaceae bacterium]